MGQTPAHFHHNPDLLAVLPAAATVVEVGCSIGAMAKAYKEQHPSARYLGIEVDEAYGAAARRWCDAVLIGDAEAILSAPGHAEALRAQLYVFGDSLEHLRDPWSVLRRVHQLLEPGGWVCACIPNAQHWSLQARLSIGAWHYEDSGLLDRTHLRWFTRITMESLFREAGFAIRSMQPRIFPHPHAAAVLRQIVAMARAVGGDEALAARDAQPLQYVIRAEKVQMAQGEFASAG